ncbi:MAG: 2-dehydropantoate 2-reductase [Frankiaceae bacterium]|jgi:2-dehydropantoate 2-reductase|nr:2-dehydropantoate 2-reductase [Frankiaceae bacterium]
MPLNGGMRFVVLGAGAVGATVGGRLADAGYDVVLLARGAHAEAMARDGLRLAMPDRVVTVRVPVVTDPSALRYDDGDALLLTTKTQDTSAVLDALPRRDAAIFCMQNGVANERLAARRGFETYGVVVMLPAVFLEPGHVDAQGSPYSGLLDLGRWPHGVDDRATDVATALSASGFVSAPEPRVMRWKYAKLLRNLGNSLEAMTGHDLDESALDVVRELDARARAEAEECYRAAGIDWASDDEWAARRGMQVQWAPVEGRDRRGGSTWQSLARATGGVEADYLNGEIVLLGAQYGVATPVNRVLQREVAALARRGGSPGSVRPSDLLAVVT